MTVNLAAYWRENKTWAKWLGLQGTVIASSYVHVAAPSQEAMAPYSYVLVDFGDHQKEFMGAAHQTFEVGDKVECVLRKTGVTSSESLIQYGIKVQKIAALENFASKSK